jgi:hypothetical protein
MCEALEHWLCRGVLWPVSPPFSDIGVLNKHHQFTAHLTNKKGAVEMGRWQRSRSGPVRQAMTGCRVRQGRGRARRS